MKPNSHQNLEIIMFEEWLGITPMSPSDTLSDYKNQYRFIIPNQPTKMQGINPMYLCAPWADSYLQN